MLKSIDSNELFEGASNAVSSGSPPLGFSEVTFDAPSNDLSKADMDNAESLGWVKLHRKLLDWQWFSDSSVVHLFITMLLLANHKQNKWRGITVERGQLITGLHSLSDRTGISIQRIRTALSRLETTQEIRISSTNKYSIITVCKYDDYQQSTNEINKPATSQQQTTNKQSTTNKNDKNDKNDKKNTPYIPQMGDFVFPNSLNIDSFKNLFMSWISLRLKMKKPKHPQKMFQSQLGAMANMTAEQASACVSSSIMNEYQGLFPEKFCSIKTNTVSSNQFFNPKTQQLDFTEEYKQSDRF